MRRGSGRHSCLSARAMDAISVRALVAIGRRAPGSFTHGDAGPSLTVLRGTMSVTGAGC